MQESGSLGPDLNIPGLCEPLPKMKKNSALLSTCQTDKRNIFSYINLEVLAFKCLCFAYLTLMHYRSHYES